MSGCRPRSHRVPAGALAGLLALCALSGCASTPRESAAPAHADVAADTVDAATVLDGFDRADSIGSSSGSVAALRVSETQPQLSISLAAVRRNRLTGAKQPAFHHLDPVFAVAGDSSCFLASATLWTGASNIGQPDVSEFVRSGAAGAWQVSANVQVARQTQLDLRSMSAVASAPTSSPASGRLDAVAAELFARTVSTSHRTAVVAASALLDNQFAAGWRIYVQSLARAQVAAVRTLRSASWSTCSARVGLRTVAFLTADVTDTLRPAAGAAGPVTLPPVSPDLQGLGRATAATGSVIAIRRVQLFLVSVPAAGPATLLGVSDAPVSMSVTR